MFDNERYITKGIRSDIDEGIQIKIWNIIDRLKSMPNFSMDFLQVFELKKIRNTLEFNSCYNQEIIYFQEEPEYKENIFLKIDNPVDVKIYVIDDSEHTVMMKASEY